VVAHHPRCRFALAPFAIAAGQSFGMRDQVVEHLADYLLGQALLRFQRLAVVEGLIQEALGLAALFLHLRTERRQPLWIVAPFVKAADSGLLHTSPRVFDQVGHKAIEHRSEEHTSELQSLTNL